MEVTCKKMTVAETPAGYQEDRPTTSTIPGTSNTSGISSPTHAESLKARLSSDSGSGRFSDLDCNTRSQGYRLIDLACLNDVLQRVHWCPGASLTVIDTGVTYGLCCTLAFMCLKCSKTTNWDTSDRVKPVAEYASPGQLPFDVNRRASYAVSEIGLGREGLATFCGIMGMPLPSNTSAWQKQIKKINCTTSLEFDKEAKQAALRLRTALKNETEKTS